MARLLVSVVNYCDPDFGLTIKSLWENAENKESLVFSLVSEDEVEYDFSYIPAANIVYRHLSPDIYRGGVAWARNLAVDVDIDYDYLIQFDSHTRATYGWDTIAVRRYEHLMQHSSKFIISYAPPSFYISKDGSERFRCADNHYGQFGKQIETITPGFQFPGYAKLRPSQVVVGYWVTCMYLVAPKSWVDEVGISKESSFSTEEFNLSLRTFAKGWTIYAVGARETFHLLHTSAGREEVKRKNRPWGDARKEAYWEHVVEATRFLGRLLRGEEDVAKDTVLEYFKATGMNTGVMYYEGDYNNIVGPEFTAITLGMPPRHT